MVGGRRSARRGLKRGGGGGWGFLSDLIDLKTLQSRGRKREEDLEGWSIVLLGRIKKHTRDRLFVILMKKLADKGIVARGLHLVETLHQDPSLFLYSVAANKTRGFKADLSGRGVSSRADWKEASLQHWKRDFAGNLTGDAFIFSINILRIYIVSFYVINFMHVLKLY